MVSCKTVGEYKRNQEKIRKFCLDEAKQLKAACKSQPVGETIQQQPNTRNTKTGNNTINWSPAKVRKVVTHNQSQQQNKKP